MAPVPDQKVRYAVVGAGWISQEGLLPGVAHTGNSAVTALVTGTPQKAKVLGQRYGIPRSCHYEEYDSLLDSGEVDAIYLALPNTMHRNYAVRALSKGIHVLCEKPMATTEEDCQDMILAAEHGRAKLMIAYRLHFEPATIAALEIVRSGTIGTPRLFSSVFTQHVSERNHRSKGEYWAGPLADMGPYPINAARHLFEAEPVEVMAASARRPEPKFKTIDETVAVTLRFPDDRLAQFTVSFGANPVDEYRIVGTKGDLQVSPGYMFGTALKHRLTVGTNVKEREFPAVDQFGGELKYFSECVLADKQPEPDGREGLADVCVLQAIERSLRMGAPQPVRVPDAPTRPSYDHAIELDLIETPELVDAARPDVG
jgi:predicted dehydrogenase